MLTRRRRRRLGATSSAATPTVVPSYHPTIDLADFTAEITNPYRPSQPSTTYGYEANGTANRDSA